MSTDARGLTPEQLETLFQQAMAFYQQSNLERAWALCAQILAAQPRSFNALQMAGTIAGQTGNPHQALQLFDAALEVNSNSSLTHLNRGAALRDLRQFAQAVTSFDRAIAIDGGFAEAHASKGAALFELGQLDAALISCNQAVAIKVGCAEAYSIRGNVLKALGQPAAALASYDQCIVFDPDDADTHYNRALVLAELGQLETARRSCDRAIALRPNHAEAHCSRGAVLAELGQRQAALTDYATAIRLRPNYAEAHCNRGKTLHELGQLEAALTDYDRAVAISAGFAEAYCNRGKVLADLGRMDAATSSYDRAIAIRPDYAQAHFNRSMALLLCAQFERGSAEYEWRWRTKDRLSLAADRHFGQPLWLGEQPLAGKTILLHFEQGLGDTLQFCRYAPMVAALGARVILEVQPKLVSLLRTLPDVVHVVASGSALPPFDFHCPLMSLPLALKTSLPTIPSSARYLSADPDAVRRWRGRLGNDSRPRIGLAWSGNALQKGDAQRSIPLQYLLARLPAGFQYVSLHKEVRAADAETLRVNRQIRDFADEQGDFGDAAALCECMDLVISVDTSLAHLSAAVGTRTWIMLPFHPDWRWLLDRDDSPWYPSVRLYRQVRYGDWQGVCARIAADLTSAPINSWRSMSATGGIAAAASALQG